MKRTENRKCNPLESFISDLCRHEDLIREQLLDNNLQGLAAAIEAAGKILPQGKTLIAPEAEGDAPIFTTMDPATREKLMAKLTKLKVRQELNRRLLEGGRQLARGLKDFHPAGEPTYNSNGEFCPGKSKDSARLDRGC